jgi:hypothetical protein
VSDETPAEQTPDVPAPLSAAPPASAPRSARPGEAVTEGGYNYTLVDDTPAAKKVPRPKVRREPAPPMRIARPLLAALIVVPAVIVGAVAWFIAGMLDDGGGGDDARTNANVSSIINVFGQSQGGRLLRLEGELPPGLPDDLPAYPGARVVSSLVQSSGDNAVYFLVYDTDARIDDVAGYFSESFAADPWQVDVGQDAPNSAAMQFTKIDDAGIEGQVLLGESTESDVTTIFLVLSIVGGAGDVDFGAYEPPVSKPLPEGFPDGIPPYPDAIVTETIFERAPQGDTFGLTMITRDSAAGALDFFREEFEGKGWTVVDGDASGSGIEDAVAISFESDDATVTGNIAAGTFVEDRNYTHIELQVRFLEDDDD